MSRRVRAAKVRPARPVKAWAPVSRLGNPYVFAIGHTRAEAINAWNAGGTPTWEDAKRNHGWRLVRVLVTPIKQDGAA